MVAIGLVGNLINIWIFGSKKSYRETPSTFYFLIGSVVNLSVVVSALLNRIIQVGFGINLANLSEAWCKIRQFLVIFSTCLSLTCSCLTVIDQFFVTSRNNFLRRCSQIKWSYRIMIIVIIVWLVYTTPYFFYTYISPITNVCTITNPVMNISTSVFSIGFLFIIPVSIIFLFGWLNYRNIQQTVALANQSVDRQIIKMTAFQAGLVIFSYFLYDINNVYGLVTKYDTKDNDRKAIENFITTILSLLGYSFNTVSFKIKPSLY